MAEEETPATGDEQEQTDPGGRDDQPPEGANNPDAVKRALKAEREAAKAARTKAAELEQRVREFEDRDKTEQQKLEDRATTAEQRASEAEARLLRFEVASEKGVPISQAHRLQGSTKEEIAKDADAFLKDYRGGTGGGQLDGGARRSAPGKGDSMDAMIRQAAGREP